jgi:hypothetical protein
VDFGGLVPVRVGGDAAAQMVSEDVFHAHVLGNCIFTYGDIGRSCIVVFRDSLSAARIGGV